MPPDAAPARRSELFAWLPSEVFWAPAMAEPLQQGINLAWLVRLRWAAVVGQSLTMGVVALLGVTLPWPPLVLSLAVLIASNLLIMRWVRRAVAIDEVHVSYLVAFDILLISVQLYFTGGASNPFHFLFLVHIALASVTLGAPRLAAILALSCACFFTLFWWYIPLRMEARGELPMVLHGEGVAVAFVLAAGLIVYFVHRVATALRVAEAELARAREATSRGQRLSSLGTLAAGAAHELSTPLATIALVAKELERHLQATATAAGAQACPAGAALLDDTRLIRREVERCRAVLAHLAHDTGTSIGEACSRMRAEVLIDHVVAELPHSSMLCLDWQPEARAVLLEVASRSVTQALRSVIKNAWQAAKHSTAPRVRVGLRCTASHFILTVEDNGPGIASEALGRLGEPFFTTKSPGEGMGLGLFLTRTVLDHSGGSFDLRCAAVGGALATISLPIVGCASHPASKDPCLDEQHNASPRP